MPALGGGGVRALGEEEGKGEGGGEEGEGEDREEDLGDNGEFLRMLARPSAILERSGM